jgi:hypothetical protein
MVAISELAASSTPITARGERPQAFHVLTAATALPAATSHARVAAGAK